MDCNKCHTEIKYQRVSCGTNSYHYDCFTCDLCANNIAGQDSIIKDECRYCWSCFQKYHAVKCDVCDEIITGIKITAIDSYYHKDCFKCYDCNMNLCDQKYYRATISTNNNKLHIVPLCKIHYLKRFDNKCSICNKIINNHCVHALGKQMHNECFKCSKCNDLIEAGSQFSIDDNGSPLCLLCYNH